MLITPGGNDASNTAGIDLSRGRALQVVLSYALFGALWIFFSDELLDMLVSQRHVMTKIALFKGWIFVGLTSVLLFLLIRRMLRRIETAQQHQKLSEERYLSIFNSVSDAIFIHDPASGAVIDVNQRVSEIFGYTPEAARQLTVEQISSGIPPYTQQEALTLMQRATEGAPQLFVWQARHKSGRLFWAEVIMRLDRIAEEERLIVTVRDISKRRDAEEQLRLQTVQLGEEIAERRQAEAALRESEKQVRRKLDAILSPEADLGALELADIIDSEKLQRLMDEFHTLTSIGISIVDLRGKVLVETGWQDICAKFHSTAPESCRCIERDPELCRNVPIGTFKLYRCKNNIWDAATPIMIGEKHMGNIFLGQFIFEEEASDPEIFRQQARRYGFDEEEYLAALDRVPRWTRKKVDAAMAFYTAFAGMIGDLSYGNIKLANALEERKRAEKALQESEVRLRELFEGAPIGVYRMTLDGRFLQTNAAHAAMLGFASAEELVEWANSAGGASSLWVPPEARAAFIESVRAAGGRYVQQEVPLRRKDGTLLDGIVYMMLTTGPDSEEPCLVGFMEDITERKKLEEQLHQSQKMESIGRLAGGVAHDFNNMLSVILGSAELLKRKIPEGEPSRRFLDQICMAAERSSEVTRQLLAFSRKEVISPQPVNLNALISDSEKILGRLINEDIQLSFRPADDLWMVKVDPSQLDQILMNLAVNARDAMPNGGRLTIGTANSRIDPRYCQVYRDARPGEYVQLKVCDTGHGMDRQTMQHIFEPFFTTKGVGKGTGLGLATVYGIVAQNGGFINVYSESGHGTTFDIYFPRWKGETKAEEKPAAVAHAGSGTILLVEDEEMLLFVATSLLEELGYTVIQASTPQKAISICEEKDRPIDLILTDVVMPGLNGREMVEKIKGSRPDIKVVFMSGYTSDIVAQRGIVEEGMHYLQKPLEVDALNDKIREVLEEGGETHPHPVPPLEREGT